MKKEKRLGYVDLLNHEVSPKPTVKIITKSGVELEATALKQARASLKEAQETACVGSKGYVYEVILRRVE